MIAEGQVFADRVAYNALPWKYAAGTPNILGTIVSAQALRLLLDLALTPRRPRCFGSELRRSNAPTSTRRWGASPPGTGSSPRARSNGSSAIPGLTIYGPRDAARRSSLVAFNVAGHDPMALAHGA